MTISAPNNRNLKVTTKSGGGFKSDYNVAQAALAIYNFAGGDTLTSPTKNDVGFSWQNTNFTIATSPQGKLGLEFSYGPDAPEGDSTSELRYNLGGGYFEVYERFKLYVPSNYHHRQILVLTADAGEDLTAWQPGDIVTGATPQSIGTLHSISGQVIYLLNATNIGLNSEWGNGVTLSNDTRSLTALSVDRYFAVANNKFTVLWEGEYSSNGMSVEFNPEYANYTDEPVSTMRCKATATDSHSQGSNEPSEEAVAPFIDPATDAGSELVYTIRRKKSSTLAADDGVCEVWKDGALVYKNTTMTSFDSINNFFDTGYLMGWANSGYEELTKFYISSYEFYGATRPGDLP